jgi:hypothetical protein
MFVNYEVPNVTMLFLPQTNGKTCWAACAAGVKSAQAKKVVMEKNFLQGKYLDAFNEPNPSDPDNPGRDLQPVELNDLYNVQLGFKTKPFDVSTRDAVATFVQANAPIILMSAIVVFPNGVPQHKGYHVRLLYGVWGWTDSANEDDFQVKIFDPSPPLGFKSYQPFLFTHFKYQVGLKTGPVSTMVGQCWYA